MLKRRQQFRDSKVNPDASVGLSINTKSLPNVPAAPTSSTIAVSSVSTDETTVDESLLDELTINKANLNQETYDEQSKLPNPSSPKKASYWQNLLRPLEKPLSSKTTHKSRLSWHNPTPIDPTQLQPPLAEDDLSVTKSIFRKHWPHLHRRSRCRCNSVFALGSVDKYVLVEPPDPPLPVTAQCIDWPPRRSCTPRWEDWLHKKGAEGDHDDGCRSDSEIDPRKDSLFPESPEDDQHKEEQELQEKQLQQQKERPEQQIEQPSQQNEQPQQQQTQHKYYSPVTHDAVGLATLDANQTPRRRSSCPCLKVMPCSKEPVLQQVSCTDRLLRNRSRKNKYLSLQCAKPTSGNTPASTASSESKKISLPSVYDPVTNKLVVRFSAMKPRSVHLRRRTGSKRESKALHVWKGHVEALLSQRTEPLVNPRLLANPPQNELARKFIMRELYTTEVTFWNQLHYTKVMFHDPVVSAYQRGSPFIHLSDIDIFGNLKDLFQFSSKFIQHLNHFQFERIATDVPLTIRPEEDPLCTRCPSQVWIGHIMCELSDDMIVFLRCALDYKANRKLYDESSNNKAYSSYKEKLLARKETRQFTMNDYLIIPIQRVARYGLLLTDLLKHTDPNNADYINLVNAKSAIAGLAVAMNYAQK